MSQAVVRDAGDSGLLLELEEIIDPRVNARALRMARALEEARLPGVRDIVPAYGSVGVHLDPLVADVERIRALLREPADDGASWTSGRTIEVPVVYGGDEGPDLAAVAAYAGVSEAAVIDLHAGPRYQVFMLGFLPGFPYLGLVDSRIAAPRRASPRPLVRAGSVGIAGRQTGIYPRQSPGGWQIVGRTPLSLFDPRRTPPALFGPGDTVRFVPTSRVTGKTPARFGAADPEAATPVEAARVDRGARRMTVLSPGLFTTIQDAGRWGRQAVGVPVSGPLDPFSYRLANALVGNDRTAAVLEITLQGPELRFDATACIAVTGADLTATLDGVAVPMNQPVVARAGRVLRFGGRRGGARSYLAVGGGIAVAPVLGSRATHVLSALGGIDGRALRAGDVLPLGTQPALSGRRRVVPRFPPVGSTPARLRIVAGPHHQGAWTARALDALTTARLTVSSESNRMGFRLMGDRLPAPPHGAMISAPTFTGAIQVPPSGEAVMLMADRHTTGGYPQIATVIAADWPVAAQLAPGDPVQFEICSRRDALGALVAQEGQLLAVE